MTGLDRRALGLVLAALAVGLVVWAIGRFRPGIDGELARQGGTIIPVLFDRGPAVEAELQRVARTLDPPASVQVVDGAAALLVEGNALPGPGFRPPRLLDDGRRLFRPTPDRAERWRKRAFNTLVERLDARLEALPRGRGQATLPAAGELQLELTLDAPLDWLSTVLAPGHLELWRGDERLADRLDVITAALDAGRLKLAVREARHPGAGPLEARLDGTPLARGDVGAEGVIDLPLLDDVTPDRARRAALLVRHGPLPLPARAGPSRAIGRAR